MKKHIIILAILSLSFVFSLICYKTFVYDYDFSKAKIIYEEEKKVAIFDYEFFNVFVPNKNFKNLEEKTVRIKKVENKAEKIRLIFQEIKKELDFKFYADNDKEKKKELNYFDSEIYIENIYLDGNDLYLNFDEAFKNNIKNQEQELLIIYSIVNTYTNFDEIKRVKILIENKVVENLKYYNISDFFERDLNI